MEWQPIETAPRDGTRILVADNDGNRCIAKYVEDFHERQKFVRKAKDGDVYRTVREDYGYWDMETDALYLPHHWMPLPDPPKQAGH
jgi:hypothetical protein